MSVLELNAVSKAFGRLEVLKDVTFQVEEGDVFGFIGKNGAGKTTTMKIILGLLRPDGGDVRLCGQRVAYGKPLPPGAVGFLPDVPEYYGYMNPREYLRLCGEIAGLSQDEIKKRGGELLEIVGLKEAGRRIAGFSRGMKQRLGIAQALMNSPRLLICDEPTSALDPIGRRDILQVLESIKERTTVVFSTHILSDVERVCHRVGVLEAGRMALTGNIGELKAHRRKSAVLLDLGGTEAAQALRAQPFAQGVECLGQSLRVTLGDAQTGRRQLLAYLAAQNIPLTRLEVEEPSLEDLFLEVVK